MARDSLYEVLGLTPDATTEEIRAAYRRLSKQVHPDAGGTAALFTAVQTAHHVLSDPRRRAAYDRDSQRPGRPEQPTPPPAPSARRPPPVAHQRRLLIQAMLGWVMVLSGLVIVLWYTLRN